VPSAGEVSGSVAYRGQQQQADQSKDGQELMLDQMETTDATGELSLDNPDTYARALESGCVPGRRSTNGR
jgi:hypothetical protein